MAKVEWSTEDTLRYEDPFDSEIIYEFKNDEVKFFQFGEWLAFLKNEYYDGTPPPDFVTTINPED